jgi:hypothetical protein
MILFFNDSERAVVRAAGMLRGFPGEADEHDRDT